MGAADAFFYVRVLLDGCSSGEAFFVMDVTDYLSLCSIFRFFQLIRSAETRSN
ncbi:hypothetical protein CCP2SC5_380025 [Azospirillaceae bacterium]